LVDSLGRFIELSAQLLVQQIQLFVLFNLLLENLLPVYQFLPVLGQLFVVLDSELI
jgi:hypothetical protein